MVKGWVLMICDTCGAQRPVPLREWAATRTGPDALTADMRRRLREDAA